MSKQSQKSTQSTPSSSPKDTNRSSRSAGVEEGEGKGERERGSGLEYTTERKTELSQNYDQTLERVRSSFSRRDQHDPSPQSPSSPASNQPPSLASLSLSPSPLPLLLPISKLKPASDILALYSLGVRDFGENYVQELQEKAELLKDLAPDIRWHFVGGLQSNKCKTLAGIPNLSAIHAIDSYKKADALDRALSSSSSSSTTSQQQSQLNVYIQINTSSEPQKSGLPPPFSSSPSPNPNAFSSSSAPSSQSNAPTSSSGRPSSALPGSTAALDLATHIATRCPRLRLVGLMTIGALDGDPKVDFGILKKARERTEKHLRAMAVEGSCVGRRREGGEGGEEERDVRLELSMGMSADFELAVEMGSDCVRVGTGIFGERPKKQDAKVV